LPITVKDCIIFLLFVERTLVLVKHKLKVGMHRISGQPDIRPDNPAFFEIRYPAGYRILLAGYQAGYRILK
jgi:hypothetical protein